MSQTQPPVDFLQSLTAGILGEEEPGAAADHARRQLEEVLREQKSFVVDVQFTGFTSRGKPVSGVDPRLLRASGQLIMNRVSRIGFTADAGAADLAALIAAAARSPAELGAEGLVGALRAAGAHGIYLSTASGETYRPPAPSPAAPGASEVIEKQGDDGSDAPASAPSVASSPAVESVATESPAAGSEREAEPAATTEPLMPEPLPAAPAGQVGIFHPDEETEIGAFEILDAFPALDEDPSAPSEAGSGSGAAAAPAGEAGGGQPGSGDLYHFFRSTAAGTEPDPEELPAMLHAAESVNHFDDAAQAATRAAQRLVAEGRHERAITVLEALVREARRPDRSRLFREAATGALRKNAGDGTLHALVDRLQHAPPTERTRILAVTFFIGDEALSMLEGLLFRTGDSDLRRQIFAALMGSEEMAPRLLARAMGDPTPARTRALLEVALGGALAAEAAQKWVAEAAGHADASVRAEAARLAPSVGGRAGLRVLVDLLGDAERGVRRAAIDALGALGDAAAVPFLARAVNEASDDELQLAAIAALGRIGSGEAVAPLLGVLNRRQLFSGKKLVRAKTTALAALGRIPTPAAREVLGSYAAGKDAELASEAQRVLSLLDPL